MSIKISPVQVNRVVNERVRIAQHGRCYHLHFDIRAPISQSHAALGAFVERHAAQLSWTDFERPNLDEIVLELATCDREKPGELDKLCDINRCGAPLSHLSAKKVFEAAGSQLRDLEDMFQLGVECIDNAGLYGYAELEEISTRHVITNGMKELLSSPDVPEPSFGRLDMVALDDDSVQRDFRATEIHVTFENLSGASIHVINKLLDLGFYTAFLRRSDGGLKFIATVQGFDPDIGLIYGLVYNWIVKCAERNLIATPVTIKKEDITMYGVIGTSEQSGLQKVIRPMSLVNSFQLNSPENSESPSTSAFPGITIEQQSSITSRNSNT